MRMGGEESLAPEHREYFAEPEAEDSLGRGL